MNAIVRLIREEQGVSLAEEGLLIALIAVACIGALTLVGTNLNTLFNSIGTSLGTAAAAA